jgi:hypothetical protein
VTDRDKVRAMAYLRRVVGRRGGPDGVTVAELRKWNRVLELHATRADGEKKAPNKDDLLRALGFAIGAVHYREPVQEEEAEA